MTMIDNFDLDSIKFLVYDPKIHNLPKLQLKQSNGEDPLDVQSYYQGITEGKAIDPEVLYIINYRTEIIGFFSIASALIEPTLSDFDNQIDLEKRAIIRALLISKIGIDQNYRCFGLGKYILQYCIGLAINLKENEEIDVLLLKTTKSLAQKIYCLKYNFKMMVEDKQLVWVYKKI